MIGCLIVGEFRTSFMHPVMNEIKGLNITIYQQHHGGPILKRSEWNTIQMFDYVEQGEELLVVTTVDSLGDMVSLKRNRALLQIR